MTQTTTQTIQQKVFIKVNKYEIMNRRGFIIASIGGTAILTGCTTAGSNGNQPTLTKSTKPPEASEPTNTPTASDRITIKNRTVSQDDTGTINIEARNVREMEIRVLSENRIELDYENASFSPPYNLQEAGSYPIGHWIWSSTKSEVTSKIPFHVPADIEPRAYSYSVTIWDEPSSYSDGIAEKFSITVESQ